MSAVCYWLADAAAEPLGEAALPDAGLPDEQPGDTEAPADQPADDGAVTDNPANDTAATQPSDETDETVVDDEEADESEPAARASRLAQTDAASVTIPGENVDIVVSRTQTGAGHGTTSQCGINSNNPDLFPDGNATGAPADDSPLDEYACVRDGMQYQIELNFGQAAIAAPQTVEFTFNIANQGGSERYLRYESSVAQMCSANVPGVYSGSTSTTVWCDSRLTCTFNIEAGVSGSVLPHGNHG